MYTNGISLSGNLMSTPIAAAAAAAAAAGGLYGSYETRQAAPALLSFSFVAVFALALHRVEAAAPAPPSYQLLLVLLMVVLSFGLHLQYLPAGVWCAPPSLPPASPTCALSPSHTSTCVDTRRSCFFALMLCKNELLMPPPQATRSEKRD